VIRLLGVLALAIPLAVGALLLLAPDTLARLAELDVRAVGTAIAAAVAGVALTALLVTTYYRYRFTGLVHTAERLATGDYTITVPSRRRGLEGRLSRAMRDIETALIDTHDRATIDRLTGVANRPALLEELFTEVGRASRYERPLSVAFVDIDHFKAVNDTYGHAAGDVVLRGVAQTIAANLRASDRIGRYGGEEFMLILTETGVDEGAALTEKLRAMVQRQRFTVEGGTRISVTISIGISGGVGKVLHADSLVRDADAAMYSAKSLGRNQTYIFSEPDDDARVTRAPISEEGRARAEAIGREARAAATAALTAVLAPLPHYRGQPSALIASIVVSLARQLELPDAEVDQLRIAALLHDVGKVAIPREILDKPSTLTAAEWRTVVQHPRIGQVILEQAAALRDSVPIILHHHERYAGHGYPYGLRAEEIPLGARIVAIADAYDAMVHDRPYKRAISHEAAIEELRRHAGTQFDPELVELFCELYASHAPEPEVMIAIGSAPVEPRGADTFDSHVERRRKRNDLRPADPAPPAVPEEPGTVGEPSIRAVGPAGVPPGPSSRPVERGTPRRAGPRQLTEPDASETMAADGSIDLAPRAKPASSRRNGRRAGSQ
jgi:diguanylate cyclase (GGDEF)-like protein